MSDVKYRYQVTGTAFAGQTWEVSGVVEGHPGSFPDLLHEAMRRAFRQLVEGNGTYSIADQGCTGPYTVTGFALELQNVKPRREVLS